MSQAEHDRMASAILITPSRDIAQRTVEELSSLRQIHLIMNRIQPKLLRQLRTTIDDAMDTAGLPLLGLVPRMPRWCWPPAADVLWPR
mgnify:CR=1 FL=1